MKLNQLFRNRRNIYFTVLIILALLLAGGLWQYRMLNLENQARLQIESQMQDNIAEDTGIQIIPEKNSESSPDDTQISEVANTNGNQTLKNAIQQKEQKKPTNDAAKKATTPEKAIPAIKVQENKLETMAVPVFGTISMDFSDKSLVYSKTLELWATHMGLDIKAEEGSPVRAAMDGTIVQLTEDPCYGLVIVIDHGDGIKSKYSSLSTLDLVTLNQKVKKGDVISGVGKTALYEIADEPHLHFEVLKGNKNLDPKMYLPKQSLKR